MVQNIVENDQILGKITDRHNKLHKTEIYCKNAKKTHKKQCVYAKDNSGKNQQSERNFNQKPKNTLRSAQDSKRRFIPIKTHFQRQILLLQKPRTRRFSRQKQLACPPTSEKSTTSALRLRSGAQPIEDTTPPAFGGKTAIRSHRGSAKTPFWDTRARTQIHCSS